VITSRTKKQLLVFVILTLVGVTYVGARYARLDRLFYDAAYEVNVHFKDSGGIFTGAEVTYRGVGIGQVSDMELIQDGVNVVLSIDKDYDHIPADTLAQVANKSAVGEQYVDLKPRTDSGPYLENGSVIEPEDTKVPVSTTELLTNTSALVNSVPLNDLRTVVSEFGSAFHGAAPDIARIIDTTNEFIRTANDNFDVTTALIRDSNTVLRTQAAKGSAIRSFSRNLQLFTDTIAGHDDDLRTLIENGSATVPELREFLEVNQVNLGQLINNLVTTGEVTVRHLDGTRAILVIYPYVVAGGFTVAARNADGTYNANFGMVMTQGQDPCENGYDPSEQHPPSDQTDYPMDVDAHCANPPTLENGGNPRGAQNAPRAATGFDAASGRAPIGTYDVDTGEFTWGQDESARGNVVYDGGAAQLLGKDSWKWMLLQPALGPRR
jgi:phospholipid/cholesterol/gamma-HCH transport system substrate-binding protein